MAKLDFTLPDIGEGVTEAEIVEWKVEVGQAVKEGEVIAAVMTDKATVEMEAPADGVLLSKGGDVGDTLPVGTTLFSLQTTQDLPQVSEEEGKQHHIFDQVPPLAIHASARGQHEIPNSGSAAGQRTLASPAVRRRAKMLGIDLAEVPRQGDRVLHDDLDRFLLGPSQARPESAEIPTERCPAGAEQIRVIGLRRQIARRMQDAKRHIPHFTYVEEVDVTRLEQYRQSLNSQNRVEPEIGLLPFLCAATCRTLNEFPALNAHYDDEREMITRFDDVHLGIATQTDDGLVVPVLRNADELDVRGIARGIAKLAEYARSGRLGREDLTGSTFTISSLGKLGGIAATPIINRPEVAILAPNRIIERIAMTSIGSAPRLIMNVSLSCDHRIIDGYVAASFVQELKRLIEAPSFV